MNLGIKRRKIEDRILEHFNAVDFDAKKSAWVDTDAFEDFVFSFFDMRRYYEKSDDTTVGLETLRVYMDGLRALKAAEADRTLKLERRERAGRLAYELTYQMEAVMYELERNRQDQNASGGGDGGVPVGS